MGEAGAVLGTENPPAKFTKCSSAVVSQASALDTLFLIIPITTLKGWKEAKALRRHLS